MVKYPGPQVGERYFIPWRDYAEVEITGRPYNGDCVDFVYVETGEESCLGMMMWENWMGK
jgi:hypothetical protein